MLNLPAAFTCPGAGLRGGEMERPAAWLVAPLQEVGPFSGLRFAGRPLPEGGGFRGMELRRARAPVEAHVLGFEAHAIRID